MKIWSNKAFRIAGRRLPMVSYNFGYSLLPSIFSVLVSYFVVRANGLSLWGEWVYIGAVVSFLALIAQFGIKDQLLREFSQHPKTMQQVWLQNVLLRLFPLFLVCGLCFFLIPDWGFQCSLWIFTVWLIRIFEIFSVYEKKFSILFGSELCYWLVYGILISNKIDSLSISWLLNSNLIALFLRALIIVFPFQKMIRKSQAFRMNWQVPLGGVTFFILALTGLLESRTDIFCIKWILGTDSIGRYSLIFSFLILLKNIPDFLVGPFLKNFYRSDDSVFRKLNWQLALIGILISVLGVVCFQYLFEWMYGIFFPLGFYLTAMLYVFPRFLFCMDIYRIFQQKREYLMVLGICIGMIVNGILNFAWLKTSGVESVIIAAAIGQWVMFIFFKSIRFKGL